MPECDSYTESQRYTCLDPDMECCAPEGGFGACCEIGCCPCNDDNLRVMRANPHGRRWMKPAPGDSNRDARGRRSALRANSPLRVPRHINFLRAPCYDFFGQEHFGADVCDCHPQPNPAPSGDPFECENGEQVGEIIIGDYPDCFFWMEPRLWASSGAHPWLWCRTVENHGDVLVRLLANDLFQTLLTRGDHYHENEEPCTANGLVMCMENAPESPCREGGGPLWYYQGSQCRQLWNFVELDLGAQAPARRPQLASAAFFSDPGVLALKNAVLDAIATETFPDGGTGINFEQLDLTPQLSVWGRSYVGHGLPCELLTAAASLPGSYLTRTHQPVGAELVVQAASITLDLIPYRMEMRAPGGPDRILHTYPYARLWIRAECRVRVTLPDGSCVLAPDPQLPPIVYKDADGRYIAEPPRLVEWWGYLGQFSDPPTENIELHEDDSCFPDGSIEGICRLLASDLSGLVIPAWPAMAGTYPDTPNRLYTGEVHLNFEHSGWDACCEPGGGGPATPESAGTLTGTPLVEI